MFSEEKAAMIQEKYPKGTMIELLCMQGEEQMPMGLIGKVDFIDDAGQIHVKWKNRSSLALVEGIDSFRIISNQEVQDKEMQKYYKKIIKDLEQTKQEFRENILLKQEEKTEFLSMVDTFLGHSIQILTEDSEVLAERISLKTKVPAENTEETNDMKINL